MSRMLSTSEMIDLYRRRARYYDITANLYYLLGYREQAYRKRAVRSLRLEPGATVVEIACGTGLNFPLLQAAVGSEGRIIGVDLNEAMLAQAARRGGRRGWDNIELVHSDAASFAFPPGIDAVLSTFAITLVPEFDAVIEAGIAALAPGGRFAILDFRRPGWAPLWLVRAAVAITAPFGVALEMENRHPWESLARRTSDFSCGDLYLGFSYLAVGRTAPVAAVDEDGPS